MRKASSILRDEHRSIAAVLHGLTTLAGKARDPALRPDFAVFHAMLRYIDDFPERMHHPKEDRFLFALLAKRAEEARPLIEELRAEHVQGAKLIRELEAGLRHFETHWPDGGEAFAALVDAYAQFHWKHMRKEEDRLLPLAERMLTAQDWGVIDAAFAANEDPVADLREKDFDTLFTRIVTLAPAPVGVGKPWARS